MHSFAAYCRLHLPVTASNLAVIRAASRRINAPARFNPNQRGARHEYFRAMLDHHQDARDLARRHRL